MGLPVKKHAVGKMLQATPIRERRACAMVVVSVRDSWRCPPHRAQADLDLTWKIVELAHGRRRLDHVLTDFRSIAKLLRR